MKNASVERFLRAHLKTRHLVLLVELGRHRSILHAAEAAGMTQPAASRLLAELEYVLGMQLFERVARGIVPNAFGEVMIRRAGAALAEMAAAYEEVEGLASGVSGRVVVGSVITPSTRLVPDAVRILQSRCPSMQVSIEVDTSKPLLQRLRNGELDLMIGRVLDSEAPEELHFDPLTDEPHCLVARAGHPLAARAELTLAEVAEQGWIMPGAGSVLRDRLCALFLGQGLDLPAQTVETQALPVTTCLLLGSDMVTALPLEPVRTWLDSGLLTVLPIDLGLRMDVYGIVTRRHHQPSPAAQAMLDALRQAAMRRAGLSVVHPNQEKPVVRL